MNFAQTLNDLVAIEAKTAGQDEIGAPLTTWATVEAGVWANIKYLNGLQAIKADAQAAITRASIRLRHREDIAVGMRANNNGKLFEIEAVLPDSRKVFVDLACKVIE